MKKFIIEEEFWKLFPKAKIGVIVAKNIDSVIKEINQYAKSLEISEEKALNYLTNAEFSNNSVIKIWREAFQKFKTKKGDRSSIESLLERVSNGNHIGTINPLVDIYNSMSLKYAMPCGGEDIDTFIGDIKLTKAIGNEDFITLGTSPYEGEIVYKDDAGWSYL